MTGNLSVATRVDIINEKIEELREDFEAYLKDKSIPLEERWVVFAGANPALSNHGSDLSFILPIEKLTGPNFILNEFEHWSRVPDIKTVEWLASIAEKYSSPYDEHNPAVEGDLFTDNWDCSMDDLCEWVLENNLKSFSYDW